jgi:hypothetical protein
MTSNFLRCRLPKRCLYSSFGLIMSMCSVTSVCQATELAANRAQQGKTAAASDAKEAQSRAPRGLSITSQPLQSVSGRPLKPAPTVVLHDQKGQPKAGVKITASLSGGVLSPNSKTQATTGEDGSAVFDSLIIDRAGPAHRITFTAKGQDPVTSAEFGIRFGPPRKLALVAAPEGAIAGTAMASPIQLIVTDLAGNPVPGVRVEASAPTDKDLLAGSNSALSDHEGKVTFADLVIKQPVADLALHFKAAAASVEPLSLAPLTVNQK